MQHVSVQFFHSRRAICTRSADKRLRASASSSSQEPRSNCMRIECMKQKTLSVALKVRMRAYMTARCKTCKITQSRPAFEPRGQQLTRRNCRNVTRLQTHKHSQPVRWNGLHNGRLDAKLLGQVCGDPLLPLGGVTRAQVGKLSPAHGLVVRCSSLKTSACTSRMQHVELEAVSTQIQGGNTSARKPKPSSRAC